MYGRGLHPLLLTKMKNSVRTLAVCSVCSALGVVLLWLGSLVEVLDLTVVCLASLIVMFVIIEYGKPWFFLVWLVTGSLALLIIPNKFCAAEYLLYGGVYPIIKYFAEKLPRTYAAICKACASLLLFAVLLALSIWMFGIEDLSLPVIGKLGRTEYFIGILAVMWITGFVYDILLTRLALLYNYRIRPKIIRIIRK